jgi:hypothetical protein
LHYDSENLRAREASVKGVDVSHLPDASEVNDEDSAVAAYSQVLDSVHRANRELIKADKGKEPYDTEAYHDDLAERLKEWLEKLHPTMKAIVKELPHAVSYSFTFGTTISMTMNFQKLPDDREPMILG